MLWILLALVAVLAYGVRVNRRGAFQLVRDVAVALRLMVRVPFYAVRLLVRLICGEVRSW